MLSAHSVMLTAPTTAATTTAAHCMNSVSNNSLQTKMCNYINIKYLYPKILIFIVLWINIHLQVFIIYN